MLLIPVHFMAGWEVMTSCVVFSFNVFLEKKFCMVKRKRPAVKELMSCLNMIYSLSTMV